jgi:hypothetical protein
MTLPRQYTREFRWWVELLQTVFHTALSFAVKYYSASICRLLMIDSRRFISTVPHLRPKAFLLDVYMFEERFVNLLTSFTFQCLDRSAPDILAH